MRTLLINMMLLTCMATASQAQEVLRPKPILWLGVSGGANFNYYTGTTQTMNPSIIAPAAFHNGFGVGPYGSVLIEYTPNPVLGAILNLGYDDRSATFKGVEAPCNCPEALNAKIRYLSIEPSLRIAPFASAFYLFIGPSINYNITKTFTYTQKDQPDTKGDFSSMQSVLLSGQVGAGYDIPLSRITNPMQFDLSPFVSYHPYFGQGPRSVESMSLTTFRVGLALKFGKGAVIPVAAVVAPVAKVAAAAPAGDGLKFSIDAPISVPANRNVKETFPMRNYVFFNEGSSDIPDRYVRLTSQQALTFKEELFQEPVPKDNAGRSDRQLSAYHNILNIIGDRMRKNPGITVTLKGSSAGKGTEIGKAAAESVKKYLVDIFGINSSRITTEGRDEPVTPAEQPGGEKQLDLLRDGDRRVSISSSSPVLLAPLQLSAVQVDPLDSRIIFKTEAPATESLKSWSIELTDAQGIVQKYGPFTDEEESFSGNAILGNNNEGNYAVVMIGQMGDGNTFRKESTLHLVRDAQPKETGLRFSVLFDFDQSVETGSYEKSLKEDVVPMVPDNATIIIHGHTDIIGDPAHNTKLSQDRANDAKHILETAIRKAGKKGVRYVVYGFGEDATAAPFDNKLPEGRDYNRTVIIDIIPKK